MTILVMGRFRTAPGEAAEAMPMLAAHAATVRTEAGCDFYSFGIDVGDPDVILISERWASQVALTAHFATAHQQAFTRALRGYTILEAAVDAWDGTGQRSLLGG